MKLYISNPLIFKKFYKYISSENISLDYGEKEIDENELIKSFEFIKNLNMNFNDELIITALKKTNNHLNLSLRYLIMYN